MPVFDAGSWLTNCLESIINQTEMDWELIAIDDFSTDNSFDILQQYSLKNDRIQIYKNQSKGIIPALQLAFQQSSGTYITRMDADDETGLINFVPMLIIMKTSIENVSFLPLVG